jgi:hypothetical protein
MKRDTRFQVGAGAGPGLGVFLAVGGQSVARVAVLVTLRNWEQNRFAMEPAAQTLRKLLDREPEATLRALRGPRAV